MKLYLLCIIALVLLSNAAAIGVSPPRILLEDVPKNSTVEKSVTLSGIDPGSTLTTTLTGQGSQWVEPILGTTAVMQDDKELIFPFLISIPQKAPNGRYEVSAQIVAVSQEKAVDPNSAAVSSGVLVDLTFTVTGQEVKKYELGTVKILNLETGSPLFVVMTIKNEGNVLVQPEKVELVLKDKQKETLRSVVSEDITSVEPFTTADSVAVFDILLEPEFYFADLTIYTDQETKEILNVPFDVFEQGTFQSAGELTQLNVQENVQEIAKIDALFANQGDIDLFSTLHGEIYRENALVEVFESDPEYVKHGQSKQFTHYYTVPRSGEYTVKASVSYLGQTTETKEVTFISSIDEQNTGFVTPVLIGILIILFLIGIVVAIRRTK